MPVPCACLRRLLVVMALAMVACSPSARDETACQPGEAGCQCLASELCEGDLRCSEGLCQPSQTDGLSVTDEAARSCEVLLHEDGTRVLEVRFAEGVQGSHVREAPRTGLAFMGKEDVAFIDTPVTVVSIDGGDVQLVRTRCFDASGAPLSGDVVVLN